MGSVQNITDYDGGEDDEDNNDDDKAVSDCRCRRFYLVSAPKCSVNPPLTAL